MRTIETRVQVGRTAAFWMVLAVGLIAARIAWAGGFTMLVEAPSGWKDPRIKDAVLVVRAFACGESTSARITATAEGIVEGKRRTIPLKVTEASSGVYAIRREWPARGDWVVAIQGSQDGIVCGKLVELGPDGNIPENQQTCMCPKCYYWRANEGMHVNWEKSLPVKTVYRRITAREIDEKLKFLAGAEPEPEPKDK